jgi:hypothetical protein
MNHDYSPVMLGILYVQTRSKYFATYSSNHFNPDDFLILSKFLERENVSPHGYFDYVLGLLDFRKPPTPKKLADPLLVQRYKNNMYDAKE